MNQVELRSLIEQMLDKSNLLTLATQNDQPVACVLWYAYHTNLDIYIWSDPNSHHIKNAESDPKVGIAIATTNQKPGSNLEELQIKGELQKADLQEEHIAEKLWIKRYPELRKIINDPHELSTKYVYKFYIIKPKEIKVFNEKILGKEKWERYKL